MGKYYTDKDFIDRTKKIITQYESQNFEHLPFKKFEKTLFINCLIGLLIYPKEKWFKLIPEDPINKPTWGISEQNITEMSEVKNLKDLVRHLRNSISHNHFKIISNNNTDITNIEFEDYNYQGDRTLKAAFPINDFQVFIMRFNAVMDDIIIDE